MAEQIKKDKYQKIRAIKDENMRDYLLKISVYIHLYGCEEDRIVYGALCNLLADRIIKLENTQ